MNKVLVYLNKQTKEWGLLSIAPQYSDNIEDVTNKDVPPNCIYQPIEESEIPKDAFFYDSFQAEEVDGKLKINIDISKAKEIWLEFFRRARILFLEKLDIDFMRAVESGNTELQQEIAGKKQVLRDVTKTELPDTLEEIKATWPVILGPNRFQ